MSAMKDATELLVLERLDPFLKRQIEGLHGSAEVRQFPGGASNLTFELAYPDRSLIVRRPPPGTKARGAHDMGREATILRALKPRFHPVPEVYLYSDDEAIMGAPFFVMEKLDGVILRADLPAQLTLNEGQARQLCKSLVQTWVALHEVPVNGTELAALDRGEGYVARQIEGWTRRYRDARTPDAGNFEKVMRWLAENQPADGDRRLIHNDFRFDNLVLDGDELSRVIGVLDWELATVGDPLMDLGASLAYWVEADDEPGFHLLRRQPTHLPGMYSRAQIIDEYQSLSDRRIGDFAFYEIYGLFRLAGIAQQIYYRYYHGQFDDPRFAGFIEAVNYLQQRCERLMETPA